METTIRESYDVVIGLEVHVQLKTNSKIFSCDSTAFGSPPNTNVSVVTLAHPGTLPKLNEEVVAMGLKMSLACHGEISRVQAFDRKNYFYPDLPKGYQITQDRTPMCRGGYLIVHLQNERHRILLEKIHMEEDAGKSIHDLGAETHVDLNRAGVPLIEIVSEPDLHSAREASLYLQKVRQIVTYLGICDGNMEEGSLRCDANISIRKQGDTRLGTKTEVKNMNSFRNVERAIEYEIGRQIRILESGGTVVQETLLWDANQNVALPMRSKEEAHDYRYFPDPDLVPVLVDDAWMGKVEAELPEHPTTRRDRFIAGYGLPEYDAGVLTSDKAYADYFEEVVNALGSAGQARAKTASNWVMTEVLRVLGERQLSMNAMPVTPANLAKMLLLIENGTISSKLAKEVFEEMLVSSDPPEKIVQRKGLVQLSDEAALTILVDEVLAVNPAQIEKYRSGNTNVMGFFVGEIMKMTKGKANPGLVNTIVKKKLG